MGATLIILRHGEKPDCTQKHRELELSDIGKERAKFLAATYLGRGVREPLLGSGRPVVFFAITPHTIETAGPSAATWNLPVIAFCTTAKGKDKDDMLDECTRQAAAAIRSALKGGKNVVVVWEHHRIADIEPKQTTLRKLLNLDTIENVPVTWCGSDYDTIWIFKTRADGSPESFEGMAQGFRPQTLTSGTCAPI